MTALFFAQRSPGPKCSMASLAIPGRAMAHDRNDGKGPPQGNFGFRPKQWDCLDPPSDDSDSILAAYGLALDHVGDGVVVADMRQRGHPIVKVNAAFEAITGYAAAEAIGKNCRYLQGSDRLQPEIAEIRAALTEGRACSVTLRNYKRDGTMFRNALRLVPHRDASGQITHCVGLIRDVTYASGIDRLTGLLDRYGLLDRLALISVPAESAVLLLKLDIMRFHDVNNGFGYDIGDALLRAVAGRLATLPSVALARVGTNSFTLAFELGDVNRAANMVDDVLNLLQPRFILPGAALTAQFAAGYTVGSIGSDPLQLVRQAAAALQRSKALASHPPHRFAAVDERDASNRIRLANDLQAAIPNEELQLHYQPQVDLLSGNIVGAEALLRWNHGVFGLQSPSRFIGVAEETGVILDIGAWALRMVAKQATRVNDGRRTPIRFSCNVSVLEFTRRDMVAFVKQVLADTGCRPEWLTLELTESLMMPEPADVLRVFRDLHGLGVEISIDDFGTGYSNLRYLERFPLAEVKIDRSFVRDVVDSPAKQVIIESIIKLGEALDIRVVAEGIETEAELGLMRSLGCSVGQGYFFSQPMDASAFDVFLGDHAVSHEKSLRGRLLDVLGDNCA
ncbi:GGDEF domain-containing phosphodiesterase [Blastomonas fulva]|uniref:Diguanylate cyclase n=2 Tax=Blastomonas fulva TaxID=1550728 RepID=A0ABM6M3A6_9SPHN|nr:GGDEF domain-containing phosphodiesterase [Blastomonas fulva]ASR50291.1 hypothetical protein B5J99_01390 [Blastomonas fulva]